MKTKIIIAGTIVLITVATTLKLFSNKRTAEDHVYRAAVDRRILVQADTAHFQHGARMLTYTGTFDAVKEVLLIPQVHGEVTGVYFDEGDIVQRGARLIQIDDELLQAQYASVKANYETAKRNLARYENASQGGGVSKLQLDNFDLSMKQAESQLKQLDKQIELSRIEAPFKGTVTLRDAEVGSMAGTSPVARITDLSQLKLEIAVPEKEIGLFKEGEAAQVTTSVYPAKIFTGTIDFVADRADDAHNYTVKILIDNNDKAHLLKAGMYGTASVSKGLSATALFVPRTALLGSAKNPQVFVVANDKAKLVNIQTGAGTDDAIEIVSGISNGDVVITSGQINLTDGSNVQVIQK